MCIEYLVVLECDANSRLNITCRFVSDIYNIDNKSYTLFFLCTVSYFVSFSYMTIVESIPTYGIHYYEVKVSYKFYHIPIIFTEVRTMIWFNSELFTTC